MVYSSLAILITNFFLTMLMNIFFPIGLQLDAVKGNLTNPRKGIIIC